MSPSSLHQSQADSANGVVGDEEEEPDGDVGVCTEPGAVDVKRKGHVVRMVKYGCMTFAVAGEGAKEEEAAEKAADLAKQLYAVLQKVFQRPTPLKLRCPICGELAPSIPILTWHGQTECSNVLTPRRQQYTWSTPMAFLISDDVLRLLQSTNAVGLPLDILNPLRLPIAVGPSAVHRFAGFSEELKMERQALRAKKREDIFELLRKKQKWLRTPKNTRPLEPKLRGFPDSLLLQFMKNYNDWPPESREVFDELFNQAALKANQKAAPKAAPKEAEMGMDIQKL